MRRILLAILVLFLLAAAGGIACFDQIVTASMSPSGAFGEAAPPRAPDYTKDEAWTALPWREDSADLEIITRSNISSSS